MQKLILRNFFLFSFPSSLVRIIPFFILPITSQYFSLNEFGIIVLFEVLIIPFHILMGFGSNHIINSSWHYMTVEGKKKIIFTVLFISFIYWLIGFVILGGFLSKIIEISLFLELKKIKYLKFYFFLMSFSLIPGIIFSCWAVIQNKGRLFVYLRIIQTFAILFLSIYFTITYQNFEVLILSKVIISFIISSIELTVLLRYSKFEISLNNIFDAIKLSLSFIARNMLTQIRFQFDRLFISYLYGPGQFVLYTYSGKIHNFFIELSEHFQNAYNPELYNFISRNKGSVELEYVFFTWSLFIFYFNSCLIIFGRFFIDWISNSLFIDAIPIINIYSCVIILSLPFLGCFEILIHHKQSKFLLIISLLHGFLTVTLGYLLISNFGLTGGAISIWFGSLFTYLMYYIKKQSLAKIYFIKKTLLPYVFIYHFSVGINYFGYYKESYIILILMLVTLSYQYYDNNKTNFFYLLNQLKTTSIKDIINY